MFKRSLWTWNSTLLGLNVRANFTKEKGIDTITLEYEIEPMTHAPHPPSICAPSNRQHTPPPCIQILSLKVIERDRAGSRSAQAGTRAKFHVPVLVCFFQNKWVGRWKAGGAMCTPHGWVSHILCCAKTGAKGPVVLTVTRRTVCRLESSGDRIG